MLSEIDVSDIIIETERLILRPWKESDLPEFQVLIKTNGLDKNWNVEDKESRYYTTLLNSISSKDTLALELKENNKIIGTLLFGTLQNDKNLISSPLCGRGIGYMLNKDLWGNGLMLEAVKAVIVYCFNVLELDFLLCAYKEDNLQSKRVIEKCGFKYYTKQNNNYVFNILFKKEYPVASCITSI